MGWRNKEVGIFLFYFLVSDEGESMMWWLELDLILVMGIVVLLNLIKKDFE